MTPEGVIPYGQMCHGIVPCEMGISGSWQIHMVLILRLVQSKLR